MRATSQNGYPVLFDSRTDGPLPRLRKFEIPGASGRHLILRDGSTGFLLCHMALWFHESIEALDMGTWDEWGYAVRPVRGQTSGYSNHASGTAMDLNATRHPMGVDVDATFSEEEIDAVIKRLGKYESCLVWGGRWSRPDGMHFEIAQPLRKVERIARKLSSSPRGVRIMEANPGLRKVVFS